MIRFCNGLNRDLANIVKLQHYIKLNDMLYMAIKVERQLNIEHKKDLNHYGGCT